MARHAGLAERGVSAADGPVPGSRASGVGKGARRTRNSRCPPLRRAAVLGCAALRLQERDADPCQLPLSFAGSWPPATPGRRRRRWPAIDAGLVFAVRMRRLQRRTPGCIGTRHGGVQRRRRASSAPGAGVGLWLMAAYSDRSGSQTRIGRRFAAACGGCSASSAGIRRARRSFDSWPLAAKSIPYSAAPPPPFVPAFVRPFVLPQVLGRRMRRRVDLRPGVRFGRRLASAVGGPRRSTDADRAAAAVVAVPLHPLLTRPTSLRPSVALRRRCRSAIALERRRRSIECRSGSRRGRACASAISFGRRRLPLPPPSPDGDVDKKPLISSILVDVARAFGQRRSRRAAALLRPLANAACVPTSSARSVAADAVRGASAVADGSGGGGKSSRTFAQIGLCGAKRGAFRHRRRRARNDARNDRDRAATRCAQRNARAR